MLSLRTMAFVEVAEIVETEQELITAFECLLREMNITQYFVGEVSGIVGTNILRLGNWNEEWVERYIGHDYHYVDPVVAKARSTPKAFAWDELKSEGFIKGRAKQTFEEAGEFGIKAGYTIPVFQANGYLAVASFDSDEGVQDKRIRAALQLATIYFHARLLAFRDESLACDAQLTPRQRECLHWVARGKTDWEIGEILKISEATVHTHVEKAKRLYAVPTRLQAVVEAVLKRELRL